MLQNPCKTLGFKKNMVFKIPPGGGGKPYPASGLTVTLVKTFTRIHLTPSMKEFLRIVCGEKIENAQYRL